MYEYLRGKLVEKQGNDAIVEVGGIGYRLHIPLRDLRALSSLGNEVCFFSSYVVRETSQTLFGFLQRDERDLFNLLMTFSGIGPKTALSIISHLEIGELAAAVHANKTASLVEVPGIGKKTAERLLLELKGKIDEFSNFLTPTSIKARDALNALINLGYSSTIAEKAVQHAVSQLPETEDLAALIAAALRSVVH